jgi:GT2 family glycosyltransferase
MVDNQRISFVVPAFNAATTLPRTLDSLLAQDCGSWLAIVVDDGSTDATRDVAERYNSADERIRVFSQANAGTAAARNAAVREVDTEFIALLDADDYALPHYVSTMAAFVEAHPNYDIYSCNAWRQLPDGTQEMYVRDDPRPLVSMKLADYLRGGQHLFAGGAQVRTALFREVGGFRPDVRYAECEDLWMRALASGARHVFCPEPLVVYDKGVAGQKSSDRTRIIESYVRIGEDLLASGMLDPEDSKLAEDMLARNRYRLAHGGTPEELARQRTEAQANSFRVWVTRVAGEKRADAVIAAMRPFTGLVRPLRLALNRKAAKLKRTLRS